MKPSIEVVGIPTHVVGFVREAGFAEGCVEPCLAAEMLVLPTLGGSTHVVVKSPGSGTPSAGTIGSAERSPEPKTRFSRLSVSADANFLQSRSLVLFLDCPAAIPMLPGDLSPSQTAARRLSWCRPAR